MASAAHVFVADLDDPELGPADAHHLERVLRLQPGQVVTVGDGAGRWRRCRWIGPCPSPAGRVEPDGPVVTVPRSGPEVTVAFALAKGNRPEWTVQKLTEAGVDRIVPLAASRSVVRWPQSRQGGHLGRLERVAREAAMQCRRIHLPRLGALATVAELAAGGGDGLALAHPGGAAPSLEWPVVAVGPEGGWGDDELALGLPLVGLGPTVLRCETAAVAAAVILCSLRAGLVRPAGGNPCIGDRGG